MNKYRIWLECGGMFPHLSGTRIREKWSSLKKIKWCFAKRTGCFRWVDRRYSILINCEMLIASPVIRYAFLSQQPLVLDKRQSSDKVSPCLH